MSGLFGRLKSFDAYSKPLEDFRIQTLSGGAVTLASAALILLLFVSELGVFLSREVVEELFVDASPGDERVQLHFDIAFPALACNFVTVDAMDVSGDHQSDVSHSVWKTRLNADGKPIDEKPDRQEVNTATLAPTAAKEAAAERAKREAEAKAARAAKEAKQDPTKTDMAKCGSCYGAETEELKCCNSCDDVKTAYRHRGWALQDLRTIEQCKNDAWAAGMVGGKAEGCRIKGSVKVAKVAGNFHIAPGETLKGAHSHVHDLHSLGPQNFNTSHLLSHVSFGDPFPGKNYPLDNYTAIANEGGVMFQYYVKIVPTMYVFSDAKEVLSYQFSVTTNQKPVRFGSGEGLPGFFLQYDFSPLIVKFTEREKHLASFAVSVCAIIGGVFTVASLVDAAIYRGAKAFQAKLDLGKAG